mgnify:CR=1 FL=1
MVKEVLVMGGGSAGLIAALALKHRFPKWKIRIVASSKRGTIGVGEGTVPFVVDFFHRYLGFSEQETFAGLDPVFKLGVEFKWGRAGGYLYSFDSKQHLAHVPGVSKTSGFYSDYNRKADNIPSALIENKKALPVAQGGRLDVPPPGHGYAWHLENHKLVSWLSRMCKKRKIASIDADVCNIDTAANGDVTGLRLDNGAVLKADLFIDASGFSSQIIGKKLQEPFIDYSDILACNRAVVGGWERNESEPILPYTIAETMESGWAWQIDHPEKINRGYVYSSAFIETDQAMAELKQKNPRIGDLREVKFRSGRYARSWVGNTVSIGNAYGFVEPLEATAIMAACLQTKWLVEGLTTSDGHITNSLRKLYNRTSGEVWTEIRDFLALHYKYNRRLKTDFWKHAQENSKLGNLEDVVQMFEEMGPSLLGEELIPPKSLFGLAGVYSHLIGMEVSSKGYRKASTKEKILLDEYFRRVNEIAHNGKDMSEVAKTLATPNAWIRNTGR